MNTEQEETEAIREKLEADPQDISAGMCNGFCFKQDEAEEIVRLAKVGLASHEIVARYENALKTARNMLLGMSVRQPVYQIIDDALEGKDSP